MKKTLFLSFILSASLLFNSCGSENTTSQADTAKDTAISVKRDSVEEFFTHVTLDQGYFTFAYDMFKNQSPGKRRSHIGASVDSSGTLIVFSHYEGLGDLINHTSF